MLIKNKNLLYILCIIALLSFSCLGEKKSNQSGALDFETDSTSLNLKYAETIFTIPSPSQTLFLLKNLNQEFNPSIISLPNKPEKYNTTFNRSIMLGIWGADISYLNLYNQKELGIQYLQNMMKLLDEMDLTEPFDGDFFKRVETNFGNNDSVSLYLSEAFRKCDEYLKFNDQQEIGTLIITGGWIESFYFLINLYDNTNDKQIFALILYHKEIIDNLIKLLSPLYNKSIEYTDLIDDITNIAYEFDVIDTEKGIDIINSDSINNKTIVKNKLNFILSGSKPDKLAKLVEDLRNKHIFN